ncbi:MAG: hypothetical protein ABI200_00320 [Gaiellales bacterium]
MFPNDPYDPSSEHDDELPELPIPRPGERPPAPASLRKPLAPPKLAGGASLTANDGGAGQSAMAAQQALDAERFNWELAAQLTSGMLANPAHANASVKDAMSVFDQFRHEMQIYTRIAEEAKLDDSNHTATRGDYFHDSGPAAFKSTPTTAATPLARPSVKHNAQPAEKLPPSQPRPSESYRAISPGLTQPRPGDSGPRSTGPSGKAA